MIDKNVIIRVLEYKACCHCLAIFDLLHELKSMAYQFCGDNWMVNGNEECFSFLWQKYSANNKYAWLNQNLSLNDVVL